MDDKRNKQPNIADDIKSTETDNRDATNRPDSKGVAQVTGPEAFNSGAGICWDENEEGQGETEEVNGS